MQMAAARSRLNVLQAALVLRVLPKNAFNTAMKALLHEGHDQVRKNQAWHQISGDKAMTNPLQTRFQTPYKRGDIPYTNRLHTPCAHTPPYPLWVCTTTGGCAPRKVRCIANTYIGSINPLIADLPLRDVNASRVPASGDVQENLETAGRIPFQTVCSAKV